MDELDRNLKRLWSVVQASLEAPVPLPPAPPEPVILPSLTAPSLATKEQQTDLPSRPATPQVFLPPPTLEKIDRPGEPRECRQESRAPAAKAASSWPMSAPATAQKRPPLIAGHLSRDEATDQRELMVVVGRFRRFLRKCWFW
jgi:hypothetical protein